MDSEMRWGGGRIHELTHDECWELLSACSVGRIGWAGPSGPTIHPINHVVGEGVLWLRTTPYSLLTREADESAVAFEVDDIDETTRTGWSVLVRGTAHLSWPGAGPEHVDLVPWVEGARPVWVQIRPVEVSGRRLT